jgi:hypothetical protein
MNFGIMATRLVYCICCLPHKNHAYARLVCQTLARRANCVSVWGMNVARFALAAALLAAPMKQSGLDERICTK